MPSRPHIDISQIIEELSPENILIVDLKNTEIPVRIADDCTVTAIHDGDVLHAIDKAGTHDLAIVTNTLEFLDKKTGGNVLARLRDIYSRRLLVTVATESDTIGSDVKSAWTDAELIAFGLRLLTTYPEGEHLYEYNILNYKSIPDWLNSKNWANPELWDKFRW